MSNYQQGPNGLHPNGYGSRTRNGQTQSGPQNMGNQIVGLQPPFVAPGTLQPANGFFQGWFFDIPYFRRSGSQPSDLSGQPSPVYVSMNMTVSTMPIPSEMSTSSSGLQGTDTRPQNAEGKSSEAALAEATVRTIPQKRSAANSPPAQPPRQKKGPAASEPRRPLDATFVNSLRGYLSEHSGSELREIVLSLCLNKTGAYDSVRDRIKKMEAQKNVTIPFSQGGLGLHLQYLRTSELESLILHICDVDRSDFTKELLKQLLLVMQQRKASGRNTT